MRNLVVSLAGLAVLALPGAGRADIPKPSDVPPLINKLSGGNAKARAEAAREIGDIGLVKTSYTKPAIPALIRAAQKDKDNGVREAALIALGECDAEPEIAMPVFLAALKEKDDKVRTAAARGAAHLGGDAQDAMPELKRIREELQTMERMEREKKKDLPGEKRELMRVVNDAMQSIQHGPRRKK